MHFLLQLIFLLLLLLFIPFSMIFPQIYPNFYLSLLQMPMNTIEFEFLLNSIVFLIISIKYFTRNTRNFYGSHRNTKNQINFSILQQIIDQNCDIKPNSNYLHIHEIIFYNLSAIFIILYYSCLY